MKLLAEVERLFGTAECTAAMALTPEQLEAVKRASHEVLDDCLAFLARLCQLDTT